VVPTEGGLGSVAALQLPDRLGAIIKMFAGYDETFVTTATPELAVTHPVGSVNGGLAQMLAPALPPVVSDIVTSPIVVLEALIDALASSGQALIIPFFAGAAGFFAPGVRRRRDLIAEALGSDSDA